MITKPPRPCERQCKKCGEFKHYSRFRSWKDERLQKRYCFCSDCRDCEQKERNEKKNADRARAIIEQRAKSAAAKAGASFEFFMTQMNYRALVPVMRAMMTPEGLCLCCGHEFLNERDIQIEHLEPPRDEQDWARLHTRNLRMSCASCNGTKGKKPFADWLDEQEGARQSNLSPLINQKTNGGDRWQQLDMGEGWPRNPRS